jgi:cytidylate kinase
MPLEAALSKDEATESRVGRLLGIFSVHIADQAGAYIPAEVFAGEEPFKRHSEEVIRLLASQSDCVVVGRASAIVLADFEETLYVRVDGLREQRISQAVTALGITPQQAAQRLTDTDRARALYVKHFYGRDWSDARLYHAVLNSGAISLHACAQIVLTAAADRFGTQGIQE